MADVTDFPGALDAAAAVTIARFAEVRIVGGQRLTLGSDVVAGGLVVARRADHRGARDRPLDENDGDDE